MCTGRCSFQSLLTSTCWGGETWSDRVAVEWIWRGSFLQCPDCLIVWLTDCLELDEPDDIVCAPLLVRSCTKPSSVFHLSTMESACHSQLSSQDDGSLHLLTTYLTFKSTSFSRHFLRFKENTFLYSTLLAESQSQYEKQKQWKIPSSHSDWSMWATEAALLLLQLLMRENSYKKVLRTCSSYTFLMRKCCSGCFCFQKIPERLSHHEVITIIAEPADRLLLLPVQYTQ